jgi:uncharacterized protein YqjF (DUF2071 family)
MPGSMRRNRKTRGLFKVYSGRLSPHQKEVLERAEKQTREMVRDIPDTNSWSFNSTDRRGREIFASVEPTAGGSWLLKRWTFNTADESAGEFPEDYVYEDEMIFASRQMAVEEGEDFIFSLSGVKQSQALEREREKATRRRARSY